MSVCFHGRPYSDDCVQCGRGDPPIYKRHLEKLLAAERERVAKALEGHDGIGSGAEAAALVRAMR